MDERWVTLKDGRKVRIKTTSEYMNDLIRNKGKVNVVNKKKKDDMVNELKDKVQQVQDYIDKHGNGLTEEQAKEYWKLNQDVADIKYDLEKNYYKEISEKNIKDNRKTGFTKNVYVQARKDDLKNKNIYDALESSSYGVYINKNTPIDDILEGKNSKVSPKELYDTFKNTRNELKKEYGDYVTLYRVESQQMKKPTKNYGSSLEYTKQYGDNVNKYEIKVDDVVAITTNRGGTYEDVIVAVDGIDKYVKRS